MYNGKYAVGLDISADFFTAGCVNAFFETIFFDKNFDQTDAGWKAFQDYLVSLGITPANGEICMESTGIYSEKICYSLYNAGFPVFVEPPNKIKQSFYDNEKDDPLDARQIAEFLFRYPDKKHAWQPRNEIVYQIDSLLATREQLVRLCTACKNALKSLKRKQHRQEKLEELITDIARDLQLKIKSIDQEMERLIKTNPDLWRKSKNVLSIPNIGPMLNHNLIVITNGYADIRKYTSYARYFGISPLKDDSGKRKKKRKADGRGPTRMRKLLYLAAMRMKRNHPKYQRYYARKEAEGKPGRLILQNIENNILKLIFGVLKSDLPYVENYKSLPPDF